MAPTQRKKKSGHDTIKKRSSTTRGNAKEIGNSAEPRRKKYGSDVDFREQVKKGNRDNYRRHNPKKKSKLGDGLLTTAERKEVVCDELEFPTVVYAYNMTEAAAAIGKTPLAFKRWIKDAMIPPPILKDTIRGFNHYSEGEMKSIAKILYVHEEEYTYFLREHALTIERMWQAIEAWRKSHI